MTRDGQREDEAEMVTEAGKAHAGIDPEIISLASSVTEEGTWVRAILAQKAMGRKQAMVRDDTHEVEVAYRMEDDLDLPREIADARERDADCRHLEHILSEMRYKSAIHEMVEDFKRIQEEHKAEMASANSQLRQALMGNRLRDHINLSLAKTHRYAMGPVADVARQLENLADEAHARERVSVAAGDLRCMAGDLRGALRMTGVEG